MIISGYTSNRLSVAPNRLSESGRLKGINPIFIFLFCLMLFSRVFTSDVVTAQSSDDWFYNPFNSNSAFHRPIGTGAVYADDEHPATTTWLQHNGMKFNYEHPYGAPFVAVDETDPIVTVNFSEWQVTRNRDSLPVDVRIPKFRWPVNSIPAGVKSDAAVAIYDRTTGKIHDFYNYRYNDGAPLATLHKVHDITGLGHGSVLGERVGNSAAGVSIMFGALHSPGHLKNQIMLSVMPYSLSCPAGLSRTNHHC